MAGSLNKATLIGRLGKDPERYQRDNGPVSCSFSLATSEKWRDKSTGDVKEKTEWHNVKIFNERVADVALKYLIKGSSVYIEGQIQTRKWQDKAGVDRYSTEIVVQGVGGQLTLLDSPRDSGGNRSGNQQQNSSQARPRSDLDDDIPF